MAPADPRQSNDFPGDQYACFIPHQAHSHAQNAWIPPAPANDQREGQNIPPLVRGIAEPGRVQDPCYFDVAYQGVVDYHPQPLVGGPAFVFPDVDLAHDIREQAQPNAPVNIERNPFGYIPQHNGPDPVQADFPRPFVHLIPTPNQAGAENLRPFASHYFHHPNAQVSGVCVEAGAAGRFKVVITLESYDYL